MIRLTVERILAVRAKKGERRTKDGRLVQFNQVFGESVEECLAEARASHKAAVELAGPGYITIAAVRAYNDAAYRADPCNCPTIYEAATL